jgi:F-type H+-transporting ATPase subunit delta
MATSAVIARPYAKAIFEYAIEANALKAWSDILEILSYVVLDPKSTAFITNPAAVPVQLQALLLAPFDEAIKQWDALNKWVEVIVEQRRVLVLPDIYLQYQMLLAEYEKTVEVNLRSFMPLTAAQERLMIERLTKKLKRKVSLNASIDPSLLGGVVIQAGDLVIDGSVLGKINALYEGLLA